VIRSSKSKFPDGIAIASSANGPAVIIWEAKVNKYLDKEEKEKAKEIYDKTGIKLTIFYRKGRKILWYQPDLYAHTVTERST